MSPKKQPTAAKRARAAAREGGKYTSALRDKSAASAFPTTEAVDPEQVLAGLTDIVGRGGLMPVRSIDPENPQPRPDVAVPRTWGVVEAAVDGYLVRELGWSAPRGTGRDNRRPRVPVPYLNSAGEIEVVEMPPLAWASERSCWRWVFAHTGWAVDAPGQIANADAPLAPSMDLPFEVRAFQRSGEPGWVYGEDFTGSPSWWSTMAWCATADDAREVADAFIAYEGTTLRVQVWEHDRIALNTLPALHYQRDADLERPSLLRRPFGAAVSGRPDAPDAQAMAEPAWNEAGGDANRTKYALHVWNGQGWRVISWHSMRQCAGITADKLRIGVDGAPYAFGYVAGPHYPDAWAHDWTQHGRSCKDLIPDATPAERFDREHMDRVLG